MGMLWMLGWVTAGHVAHLLSAASLAQGLENLQILQVGVENDGKLR